MIKKFNYFILSLLYPIPKKIRKIKQNQLTKITFGNNSYNVYTISSSRIYTDTINFCGVLQNNELLDGPSYQIINNNFLDIKKNIILKIGTPRLKKILKGPIFVLLTGGGGNSNYFHWLFDVLPRLKLIEKSIKENKIKYFLFPSLHEEFQQKTIKILKIPKPKCLSSRQFRHIESNKIIMTSHPYVFSKNSKNDSQKIPKWISLWLKEKFLPYKSKKKFFKKIFIDRKFSESAHQGRSITNKEEVTSLLKKEGFKSIFLEDYTFEEKIAIFNKANIIVGLHGAAFANIVFCKKGVKIIEILNKKTGNQFRNLALTNNLNYFPIFGKSKIQVSDQQGNIKVSLKRLNKVLHK